MLDRRVIEDRRAFPRANRQTRRTLDWIAQAERLIPEESVDTTELVGVSYTGPSEHKGPIS